MGMFIVAFNVWFTLTIIEIRCSWYLEIGMGIRMEMEMKMEMEMSTSYFQDVYVRLSKTKSEKKRQNPKIE